MLQKYWLWCMLAGGRGADSRATPDMAQDAAVEIAERTGGAVAVSGEVDLIAAGTQQGRERGTRVLTRDRYRLFTLH